ncbi:hypothetical protein [Fimbriiglobus ruber]|uniref:Uncharacterized protein n=1 Tax=Fimbriiglobus ruber TaxID=1908690 RepID=A0A225DT47_9BACT|nr:hypothetical protein [Fimbriiglobus ruber]OWK44501.1 hypothetical protein FRUB_02433 [Fimbriiglobus ruber]
MTPNHPNGDQTPGSRTATADRGRVPDVSDALRRFRTQDPQEALGLSQEGGLLRPCIQAGVVIAILFAALTVIPYFLAKQNTGDGNPAAAAKPDTPAAAADQPKADAGTPNTPDAGPKKAPNGSSVAADATKPPVGAKSDILNKLGENGTKTSNSKVNPLDKKDDDLLKELK